MMKDLGLEGRRRGRRHRTTTPTLTEFRPADLVDRHFVASAPNQLWIADITYVATWSGFAYMAYVADVFSRRILGWQVSNTLRAELALDALEQAIWTRQEEDLQGLVHHSDRGSQYLSIRYTERLAEEGAITSVGSRGDSYDNAMAESIIGLYKSELITIQGPWRTVADVELATLTWVHWWNTKRLLQPTGNIPPVEYETNWQTNHQNRRGGHTNDATDTITNRITQ